MKKFGITLLILGILIAYSIMCIIVYHIGDWIPIWIHIGATFLLGGIAIININDEQK